MCSCDSVSKGGLQGEGDWSKTWQGERGWRARDPTSRGRRGPKPQGAPARPEALARVGLGRGEDPEAAVGFSPLGAAVRPSPF